MLRLGGFVQPFGSRPRRGAAVYRLAAPGPPQELHGHRLRAPGVFTGFFLMTVTNRVRKNPGVFTFFIWFFLMTVTNRVRKNPGVLLGFPNDGD